MRQGLSAPAYFFVANPLPILRLKSFTNAKINATSQKFLYSESSGNAGNAENSKRNRPRNEFKAVSVWRSEWDSNPVYNLANTLRLNNFLFFVANAVANFEKVLKFLRTIGNIGFCEVCVDIVHCTEIGPASNLCRNHLWDT